MDRIVTPPKYNLVACQTLDAALRRESDVDSACSAPLAMEHHPLALSVILSPFQFTSFHHPLTSPACTQPEQLPSQSRSQSQSQSQSPSAKPPEYSRNGTATCGSIEEGWCIGTLRCRREMSGAAGCLEDGRGAEVSPW